MAADDPELEELLVGGELLVSLLLGGADEDSTSEAGGADEDKGEVELFGMEVEGFCEDGAGVEEAFEAGGSDETWLEAGGGEDEGSGAEDVGGSDEDGGTDATADEGSVEAAGVETASVGEPLSAALTSAKECDDRTTRERSVRLRTADAEQ